MGSSVTIVTAIAAMAPGYTVYCPPSQSAYPWYINSPRYVVCTQQPGLVNGLNGGNFTYTGILQGAVFGFQFMGAVEDGDWDQIYNITSGQSGAAIATCNTTLTTATCSTPVTYVMTGGFYELETFSSSERNYTTGVQDSAYNYSIFVLPPVPSQPVMFIQYSGPNNVSTGSFVTTTSQYSTEYGSAMTGCLLHYGQTPYNPTNVPTLLTSSSQLPSNAVTYFGVGQSSTQVITPASLARPPVTNVAYDYHFSCYNGNGQSPDVILYNISLPTNNTGKNSAASDFGGSRYVSALVGLMGVVMTAFAVLA